MSLALAILAAGASQRLGECKALARIGEKRVLEHLLDEAKAVDDERPIIVVGAHATEIRDWADVANRDVELLTNTNWSAGRTGGVQLAALARPQCDLVIAPVDCPLVPATVFTALATEWQRQGAPAFGWLAPRFAPDEGPARFGHPVILGRDLLMEIISSAPDIPLRRLRGRAQPLLALEVDAQEVLDDLDTPEDLDSYRRRGR